jgi:hypothetical protein
MTEIERLWAEHLAVDFPDIRGDELDGTDLVLLDADIAGYVTTYLDNGGRLAPARRAALAALVRQARDASNALTGSGRDHFARLAQVAELVVRAPNRVVPAS